MCLWYLYQVGKIKNPGDKQTEDIAVLDDPEADISFENITDNSFAIYPPDSRTALLRMIEYMQNTKKLPYTEPQKYVEISSDMVPTVQLLYQAETKCHQCSISPTQDYISGKGFDTVGDKRKHRNVFPSIWIKRQLSMRMLPLNCIECGIHPVILIADVNRKVAFKCPSSIQNLKDGAENFPDSVDADLLWDKIEKNMICFGFRGRNLEASHVEPSLSCWAPFIGKRTRESSMLINTEHKKVNTASGAIDPDCKEMTEERLLNVIMQGKLKDIQEVASEIGIDCKGNKLELVNRKSLSLGGGGRQVQQDL
eukprot:gene4893-5533_t